MKQSLIFLLALTAFACSTMKINYDYDRQADFAKYKTYQLSEGTMDLPIQDLNKERVIAAIETQMAAKGFTKSDNADIIVDATITGKEVQSATATTTGTGGYGYGGYGGYRGYGYGGGFSTTQINYDTSVEGTMVISFIDSAIEKIVWQGTGTKTLLENVSSEKREKNINYAIEGILKNYPPRKK